MTNNNQNNKYCIEIYEPEDYNGPIPLCANSIGIIDGPERTKAFLLELIDPLTIEAFTCTQLVVRPRHADPIERVASSPCTVVIYCVNPDCALDAGSEYKFTGIVNWGIGKIRPVENGNP